MRKAQLTGSANRVPEAQVMAVKSPDFTDTWKPYSHKDVIQALSTACSEHGYKVGRREYSLNESQTRVFGVWEIEDQANGELNFAVGLRNSLDKHFAVGICAGERVFVCDNLVFKSDFIIFRKHTTNLDLDYLHTMSYEALKLVKIQFEELYEWHKSLKKREISRDEAITLAYGTVKENILPPSKLNTWYDCYNSGKYRETLHGFHGAVTEIITKRSLLTAQYANTHLNNYIKYNTPEILAGTSYEEASKMAKRLKAKDADISRKKAAHHSANIQVIQG